MTTFVATIGYDSTRVTRPVLTHGLEEGDEIVLVHPTNHDEDPRATEAMADVERMVTELQPNVAVESIELDSEELYDAIRMTVDLISRTDDELVFVLGGGARDVYLPVAFTAFLKSNDIEIVLQFSDITGSVSEVPVPNFLNAPSTSSLETLETIVAEKDGASLTKISNVQGTAKSTVARHVTELEERDLVRSEKHGKAKVIYPTGKGRLAIDINVFRAA